jgi:hypothetical protein
MLTEGGARMPARVVAVGDEGPVSWALTEPGPWRSTGGAEVSHHRIRRIGDRYQSEWHGGATPDLSDPATLGCLLALVREAWGDPRLVAMDQGDAGPRWTLVRWDEEWGTVDARPGHPIAGLTEAEALIAALEAAP